MDLKATYHDGVVAAAAPILCRFEGAALTGQIALCDPERNRELASWRMSEIVALPSRRHELRLSHQNGRAGERLVFTGREISEEARKRLPVLDRAQRRERGRQFRALALATAALASVIAVYLFGVPLLADRIVGLIPADAEVRLGDAVVEQVAEAFAEQGGLEICDPDPQSLANRAISRFATATVAGTGTPFTPDVQVVRNSIPNAFALPGGRAFYFNGLLEQTETPDEFAGVLAHELGHVVYRHGMQSVVATAGTGLLVGFVLGDITSISVAAGVGSALINTGFSRDSERQADAFAARAAEHIGFRPSAFAQLLARISQDDSFSRAMALLSTHPLTEERQLSLKALDPTGSDLPPAFTAQEWTAIKNICTDTKPTKSKTKSKLKFKTKSRSG